MLIMLCRFSTLFDLVQVCLVLSNVSPSSFLVFVKLFCYSLSCSILSLVGSTYTQSCHQSCPSHLRKMWNNTSTILRLSADAASFSQFLNGNVCCTYIARGYDLLDMYVTLYLYISVFMIIIKVIFRKPRKL